MKKVILFVLLFSMLVMTGCGKQEQAQTASNDSSSGTETQAQTQVEPVVLKFGHIVKPDGPVAKAAVKLSELVEERTDGAVKIEVYDSGQLGSQRDLLEGLQIGTVDMTASSPAIISAVVPKVAVLDLPYIFPDKETAYEVLDGPLGEEIFSDLPAQGYTCLTTWENGFRHITNSKREIASPADLDGLKIRVPESELYLEMMRMLGANPTPMAFGELFTALQNGTIDGQENPISQIYSSKFQEVQKYITLDGHIYATNPVLISNTALAKLTPEQQEILKTACQEVTDWQRSLVAEEEDSMLEEMKAAGMVVKELSPEELNAFKDSVAPLWDSFEDKIGKDLIDKVANYEK